MIILGTTIVLLFIIEPVVLVMGCKGQQIHLVRHDCMTIVRAMKALSWQPQKFTHGQQGFGLRWQRATATRLFVGDIAPDGGVALRLPQQSRIHGCHASRSATFLLLSILVTPIGHAEPAPPNASGATIIVAAKDSSAQAKAAAQFVADGEGDQEQINAAIRALPAAGGTVQLMEGMYDIRRVEGTLGGVLIERSFVTLAGQGAATRLVLASNQNVNVIRIIGSGVGHITIRDLGVDANRDENYTGKGDPKISHDRFEFCGIKAFRQSPRGPSAREDTHDITVRNCIVKGAQRLGIMLEGPNMSVLDNLLGSAGSDAVEILTGPGIIRGNLVEITGQTHVAIGSDRANSIIMSDNIVRVKNGGQLDIGYRSWAGSKRHVIANNVLTVEEGGKCSLAMDVRGTETTITGNNLQALVFTNATRLRLTAGNAVVTANVLENVVIEVDDQTGADQPILIHGNVLQNSQVVRRRGNLIQAAAKEEKKSAHQ